MGIFDRVKSWAGNLRAKSAAAESERMTLNQWLEFLGIYGTSAEALSEATYFACLKVLSESVGKLPLKLQQYTPERGIRTAREHLFYRALNERPNRHMTASTFWSTMEMCRQHYGNAYAWIDTRDLKRPQLWPLDPRTVRVWYDDACELRDAPDVYYIVSTKTGPVPFGSEEILHFKSHQTLDGLVGISVREQLASTIQSGVKAQKLVNAMYDSGMTAKAVLQYTGSMNDANVKTLIKEVGDYLKGEGKSGRDKLIPMPQGFSLTPLNMKLADSQFLEVKQYTALQIASAFGVKPYHVGDYTKSSYASAEAQQLSFLVDTLLITYKQYEEEIGYKILTDAEEADGYHAKFNVSALLRVDLKTQIESVRSAVSGFLMTPNEGREKLDLPWKEGGDQLIGNGSTIPLTAVGLQYQTAQEPQNSPETEPEEDPDEDTGDGTTPAADT